MRRFLSLLAAAAVLAGAATAQDEPEPEHDGRWLYQRNCESCHGETGDGRGPLSLQLGKPARSFAAGGFAFGNTREALYRTVTAGMPGSVMPGYQGALTEEERWRVVDWVRANLMPAQPPDEVERTVIELTDRPAIVRGYLPPIVEGVPMRPRGLLVGYPEGLTFEYRIDDVRLLGVRFGGFVDRTDWNGRGGTPLRPLGQVIHLFGDGDPPATFVDISGPEWVPVPARFRQTKLEKFSVSLDYDLLWNERSTVTKVRESFWVQGLSVGPAFRRDLYLEAPPDSHGDKAVLLASWKGEPRFVHGFSLDGNSQHRFEVPDSHWVVRQVSENEFEYTLIKRFGNWSYPPAEEVASLISDGTSLRYESDYGCSITSFKSATWSPEQLQQIAKELNR